MKTGKKSKRQTCRTKYKIEKKVREHHRKVKKTTKKQSFRTKKRKDPGIPNSIPFKEQVLEQVAEYQREKEAKKQQKKQRKARSKIVNEKRGLEEMVVDAQKKAEQFEKAQEFEPAENSTGSTGKNYYKEFKKVVEDSDVVLEVLDARDPVGSRSKEVETLVLDSDKRLILVLNKIDLVPRDVALSWLKYLQKELPTVCFKASTQNQRKHLSGIRKATLAVKDEIRSTSRCIGADNLTALLANYRRMGGGKTSITVGVIGFPNTGKSSLINSLKRSKSCVVGPTPGLTRNTQEVKLQKGLHILDSPGIILSKGNSEATLILRNALRVEAVEDPVSPVEAILKHCSKDQLTLHYNIPRFENVDEFLSILARKLGRLKKGGVPDANKAARHFLRDWNCGRIKYYTMPPLSAVEVKDPEAESQIVTTFGEEFRVQSEKDVSEACSRNPFYNWSSSSHVPMDALPNESDGSSEGSDDEDESDIEMSGDDEDIENNGERVQMKIDFPEKAVKKPPAETKPPLALPTKDIGNQQSNKLVKKEFKRLQKMRKKAAPIVGELSDVLSNTLGVSEEGRNDVDDDGGDYDFDLDYKMK